MITAAFATIDGVRVDAHFGRCARFDIYDITAASVRLREARTVPSSAHDGDDVDNVDRDRDDHRLQARLDALEGCALLCVASIGPGAAARVVRARVHPLKVNPDTTVVSVLDRLQTVLMGTPPPWLRKLQMLHPDHTADSSAGGSS